MAQHDLWIELMKGGKTATPLSIRMTPQMKLKVEEVADKQHLSMTGLVEKLLLNEIERMDENE